MTMKMQVPFVDLAAQHASIATEINAAVTAVMQKTNFILGEEVTLFEREFATFCDTEYAIGVDSGTSALELILRAFNIGPGDEVITAANTFIASALAISHCGATPVLVDIDPETYNINPALIEQAITPHTKAIIPVHLYGQPADMDVIMGIAQRHGLWVIEDACQAHGATYKGKLAGSLGHAAAFSFYPAKNLGAYGDGGIVVTSDAQIADSVQMLRNYGQRKKYHHSLKGYNRRLDTLQAAVLRTKLPYLAEWNRLRRQHASLYNELLAEDFAIRPSEAAYAESVYHLYVVRVENRDKMQAYLSNLGISTVIHYPIPIHLQPAYADLGYQRGDFPITEQYADQILSLPMYPELSPEMVKYVAEAINNYA